MSPEPPQAEDELIPQTAAEFEMDIKIHITAMRARKESGALREEHPYFAKRLAGCRIRANVLGFQSILR